MILSYLLLALMGADHVTILPAELRLHGPNARQQLLLEKVKGEEFVGPISEGIEWTTSDAKVVKVEGSVLVPVGNGSAKITAKHDGIETKTTVAVTGMDRPAEWSFRNHVQSVLSKQGCNSGACHGALAGKGGFKLTLRGYDSDVDHHTIVKQAGGRRVELNDPGRSLLLTKPTGAVPHRGGIRLQVDTPEYALLADWIAAGAQAPRKDDPSMERLEIIPPHASLQKNDAQPLLVRAHFNDGHVEDVTRWVKFTATNETVARVDDRGQISVVGHGEGAVTAWYLSKIVIATVFVPYPNTVDPQQYAAAPNRGFIDELVTAKLADLRLPLSPRSSDAEFIRRVHLDTIGVLPTTAETKEFLADAAADKRDRLIDRLLARSEFVDYWAYRWSDVLLVNSQRLRPDAVKKYYDWLREQVADNRPWDQFAHDVVTAKGSTLDHGAANFFSLHQDPQEMAENTCQAFCSLNINCARCHNHPLEKWTNNQYYGMANLFSRVRAKGWGGDVRAGDGARTVYVVTEGELLQPLTGKPQPPTPLDGTPLAFDDPQDRREHLAKWLTSPDNPYFARAIVNRIWANFLGVGLVEPIDDLRVSNPASNEKLLSAMAQWLVQEKYDLKKLIRLIVQSETYQRSSQTLAGNLDDKRFYSRYYPRRMMAEVLHDAYCQVTGVPTTFDQIVNNDLSKQKVTDIPKGSRAMQLKDSAVDNYFLKTFGRNERAITCECERSNEPSVVQVLHIANGTTVNEKLAHADGVVAKWINTKATNEQIIDELFGSAMSRQPTDKERSAILADLSATTDADRRAAIEDLCWSVLSSKEFIFNH